MWQFFTMKNYVPSWIWILFNFVLRFNGCFACVFHSKQSFTRNSCWESMHKIKQRIFQKNLLKCIFRPTSISFLWFLNFWIFDFFLFVSFYKYYNHFISYINWSIAHIKETLTCDVQHMRKGTLIRERIWHNLH